MQRMVPVESVVVVRDGKRVTPPIGKGFDFTGGEIAELRAGRPEAIRKPVNEGEAGDDMLDLPEDQGGGDDEAIEEANDQAAKKKARASVAKKITKSAGLKPDEAKAAGLDAPDKVDDL